MSLTNYRTDYCVNKLSIVFSFFVTVWAFRPVSTLLRTAIFIFSYHFPTGDGLQVSGPFFFGNFSPSIPSICALHSIR